MPRPSGWHAPFMNNIKFNGWGYFLLFAKIGSSGVAILPCVSATLYGPREGHFRRTKTSSLIFNYYSSSSQGRNFYCLLFMRKMKVFTSSLNQSNKEITVGLARPFWILLQEVNVLLKSSRIKQLPHFSNTPQFSSLTANAFKVCGAVNECESFG